MRLLKKALYFAAKAHEGQTRKYNRLNLDPTPYILHPMAVAAKAAEDGLPLEVQAAAFLHDVLVHTSVNEQDLRDNFPAYTVDVVLQMNYCPKKDKDHISFYARMLMLIDRIDDLEDILEAPIDVKRYYLEDAKVLLKSLENTSSVLTDELASAIVQLESTISA
jgi:(p)ppGpp synthase/HD superfamily hydrolase